MSGHSILQIIKGVQKVPGDTLSAEQGLDTIDLLDPLGFSTDTYEMKIPALKSSAVYADSPLTDGRTLISGVLGNVNETIRLTLTAGTIVQMSAMLSKLLRFKQDCNNFWDEFNQIEPVYIKHQVNGEPGPRYALLYDIDIAIDAVINPGDPTRDLTIVIEREYGWRGLAPGANPKQWTAEVNGQPFNSDNCSLISSVNTLLSGAVNNVTEWSSVTVQSNKNYVDVPPALVPGDLPALVNVTYDATLVKSLFLSLNTKPTSIPTRQGSNVYQYNTLTVAALAAGNLGTDATFVNDTGATLYPPGSANRRRANISFATVATNDFRLRWTDLGSSNPFVAINALRGRYAVFIRARQTGGAANDIKMSLRYGVTLSSTAGFVETTEVSPVIQTGTGNTARWPVTYMGTINLPTSESAIVSIDGKGLFAESTPTSYLSILLYARRTTGAGVLYVSDLILIPIDEASEMIVAPETTTTVFTYDTTGYFTRGKLTPCALVGRNVTELSGQAIHLTPKTNNRLYFFSYDASNESSVIESPVDVRVNIIPRWSGLRDV